MNKAVLIAMSGGVDSSVAAMQILKEGLHCAGGMMRLFDGSAKDVSDAEAVAKKLGIDFYLLDFSALFQTCVMDAFVVSYESGDTPNPCIECNRHLKFGALLEKAREMGYTHIATGHYARIRQDETSGRWLLYKAADPDKDQSYVLYMLNQDQLAHTLLPLGGFTKERVRQLAQEQGFGNAQRKDSQDICFVPDGDYVGFMQRYTGKHYAPGDFLDMNGNKIGRHKGAVCYTLGQRKGLGIAMGAPVYVCGKNMACNTVTVGPNEALYQKTLIASNCNWFPFDALEESIRIYAKARYRHKEQPATVYPLEDGSVRVEFDEPQRAITPGQAVVFYDGELVVGGGTVVSAE